MNEEKIEKTEEQQNTPDSEKEVQEAETDNGIAILQEAIQQVREDEQPFSSNFTLRKILGGDILNAKFIRSQILLIMLIVLFMIVYISNRYSCQKSLLEIDKLNTELKDAKYKALSTSSIITEKSRESNVLDMLKNNKDSVLHMADQPPYIINVPENE